MTNRIKRNPTPAVPTSTLPSWFIDLAEALHAKAGSTTLGPLLARPDKELREAVETSQRERIAGRSLRPGELAAWETCRELLRHTIGSEYIFVQDNLLAARRRFNVPFPAETAKAFRDNYYPGAILAKVIE